MKVLRYILVMLAVLSAGQLPANSREAVSSVHVLFIPVQFADSSFTCGPDALRLRLDKAMDYFNSQLGDSISTSFDLAPTVTLSQTAEWYAANNIYGHDRKIGVLVYDACRAVDQDIDFSLYDNDMDGSVDRIFVICAGGNEAEDGLKNSFWSMNWNLHEACHESQDYDKEYLVLDEKNIDSFAITSEFKHDSQNYELAGIGMTCHEFGHFLGFKDMYDVDGELSGGLSAGLWGSVSLMDKGNYNGDTENPPFLNAIEMEILGTGIADTLIEGKNVLTPINEGHRFIRCNANDGGYFLIECRKAAGRDSDIGASGLLIYKLDKSGRNAGYSSSRDRILTAFERWSVFNEVNCRPDDQCARLISPADNPSDVSDMFFPHGEVKGFGPVGSWSLSDITRHRDGSVSFIARSMYVDSVRTDCFQDAVILNWHSSISTEFTVLVDGEPFASGIGPYSGTDYAITIPGLKPSAKYDITLVPQVGPQLHITATTRPMYVSVPPFIELRSVSKYDDGTLPYGAALPLRVSSCTDIESIEWTLGSEHINIGADQYYHITRGGTLRARIQLSGGGRLTICKELKVK